MDELLHFEGDMLMVEDEMDAQPRGGTQRAIVTMVRGTDDGYDHSVSGGGMDGIMTRHTTGGYDDGQLSWEQPVVSSVPTTMLFPMHTPHAHTRTHALTHTQFSRLPAPSLRVPPSLPLSQHLSHLTMLKVAQPHHNTTTTMGVGMGVGVGIEQATMAPNTIPHASPGTGARRSPRAGTFDSLSTEGTRSDSEAPPAMPPAWAQREEDSPEVRSFSSGDGSCK